MIDDKGSIIFHSHINNVIKRSDFQIVFICVISTVQGIVKCQKVFLFSKNCTEKFVFVLPVYVDFLHRFLLSIVSKSDLRDNKNRWDLINESL